MPSPSRRCTRQEPGSDLKNELLDLLAAIALLAWGSSLLRTSLAQAFGTRLKSVLARAQSHWLAALAGGLASGLLAQPGTGLAARLATARAQAQLALPHALMALLGGALGALLLAAAFAGGVALPWAFPLVTAAGIVLILGWRRSGAARIGQALAAAGLVLLALRLFDSAGRSLAEAQVIAALQTSFASDLPLAVALGAGTWLLLRSALAATLLAFALASAGLLPPSAAIAALLGVALCSAVAALQEWLAAAAPRGGAARATRLEPDAMARTSVALTCATREVVRLADRVELMLRGLLQAFLGVDRQLASSVRAMDDEVDAMFREIKQYLTALHRTRLRPDEALRCHELLVFASSLEQVADAAESVLHELEEKQMREGRVFPPVAVAEVCGLHALLMHNMRTAVSLCVERRPEQAQALVAADGEFLELDRAYVAAHLERLAAGADPRSAAISTLHLDLLGELRRMNLQVCSLGRAFVHGGGETARERPGALSSYSGQPILPPP